MLARRAFKCLRPGQSFAKCRAAHFRMLHSPAAHPSSNTSRESESHAPSPLQTLKHDLDKLGPRFDIDASEIEVIESPSEFFTTLQQKILCARRRIYLSTLYIGRSEHTLLESLRKALEQNEFLQLSILTDALRGTRETPEPSCALLLAPLIRDFPDRVEICMYHTPNLTGLRKAIVPKRINEGWGLQHIKLYGIDDEVILSGANLSKDYFTNRQDRYHVIKSDIVADYFAKIHNVICNISLRLSAAATPAGYELAWPQSSPVKDPLKHPLHFKAAATSLLRPLISPPSSRQAAAETNTSIYPLLVHPPTINTELPAIKTLLSRARPIEAYTFTAGYFNPHPHIQDLLLKLSSPPASVPGTVLTASPYANGFFGSKGISGMLPAAYSRLSLLFLRAARGKNLQLREWGKGMVGQPDGWTYHAKGIWATFQPPGQVQNQEPAGPSVTLIGSSNYTARSYGLDLEVGAMIVTTDKGLQARWRREEQMLAENTEPVDEQVLSSKDRRASWKVRIAMWIVKKVGGAL